MHVCFILENSLTMMQKTSNSQTTIFDQVIHSMQTVIRYLFRNINPNAQQAQDIIHLFVTSSTEPISSYEDNNEMHLLHQIKNLECTIPTFAAEAIQSALFHLGKFRCLNESETFLGYRQGTIFEPAIIFYITDNSNCRQIAKINEKIIRNKFHLRAQYKFITIKYCSVSPNETNLYNLQKFKIFIEKQKESLMMEQVIKKVNGSLIHAYSNQEMTDLIKKTIINAKNNTTKSLTMCLSNKQYKIYNKQIIKLQFPTHWIEEPYLKIVKSIKQSPSKFTRDTQASLIDIFVDAIPLFRRTQIPLPLELTPKHLSDSKIIIDEFQQLKFYVDFTKQYVGEMDPLIRFLFNTYKLKENKKLIAIGRNFSKDKKFPLFYERKKNQFIVGFLHLIFSTQNYAMSPTFEINFSFSNFINLNSNIRSYKQRDPSSQQYFQNYISTLPIFYHKFLKFYLPNLNIILSPQTQQLYQNIHSKPVGITNLRCYEQRTNEKKIMQVEFKNSIQKHQKGETDCCSICSKYFQQFQKDRSHQYSLRYKKIQNNVNTQITNFFIQNIQNLSNLKKSLGIHDYLTIQKVKSTPYKQQLQKYNNIRRNDEEMDQFVGGFLGNPFRKINKKVKIHDEAESVWVEPEEVEKLKQMLNKQMEIFHQLGALIPRQKRDELQNILQRENIYDKLAAVKQIIAEAIKKMQAQQNIKLARSKLQIIPQTLRINSQLLKKESTSLKLQNSQQNTQNIVQEQHLQQKETQQQSNIVSNQSKSGYNEILTNERQIQGVLLNKANQVQTKILIDENSLKIPQIIEQINSKFTMSKSAILQIPVNLIHNGLYLKNKVIINEVFQNLSINK